MADAASPSAGDEGVKANMQQSSATGEEAKDQGLEKRLRSDDAGEGQDDEGNERAAKRKMAMPVKNQYLQELLDEQNKLLPFAISLPHCARLLQIEIDKLQDQNLPEDVNAGNDDHKTSASTFGASGVSLTQEVRRKASTKLPPVYDDGRGGTLTGSVVSEQEVPGGLLKSVLKVAVPVDKYPGYNFVGRLLGPRGNTLKELQKETGCKLLIRGKGSVKFRDGESEHQMQELHPHLREPLHVLIDYEGYAVKRDPTLYRALELLSPLLTPPRSDADDLIKQEQLRQLALLNGSYYKDTSIDDSESFHTSQSQFHGGGSSNNSGFGFSSVYRSPACFDSSFSSGNKFQGRSANFSGGYQAEERNVFRQGGGGNFQQGGMFHQQNVNNYQGYHNFQPGMNQPGYDNVYGRYQS